MTVQTGAEITEDLQDLEAMVAMKLAAELVSSEIARGELSITIASTSLVKILRWLRDDPNLMFKELVDICAVDYPERDPRFVVVYHLLSMHHNQRIRVKVLTNEQDPVPTVQEVFRNAGWFEREAWDMYGVAFANHEDLRRLLTDYGFEGHPLRKDFPLTGYVELRYDPEFQRVVYEPVQLRQDFRTFDFLSPWEGVQDILPGDEKAKPGGQKPD